MTSTLRGTWELRNAAAETLILVERQLQEGLASASRAELVSLLESFSPARSPGPEWTRSFDPLVEHLWAWCDPSLLEQVEADFRARGAPWIAVANALAAEHGEHIRRSVLRHTAPSRLPAFTVG